MKINFKVNFILSVILILVLMLNISYCQGVFALATPKSSKDAITLAVNEHAFLFLVFYREKDELFNNMAKVLNDYKDNYTRKIFIYNLQLNNPDEKAIIEKYGANSPRQPLLYIFAPNGKNVCIFTESVTAEQLDLCMISELSMKIQKPSDEGKLVLVLLQNNKTKFNDESTKTAYDLYNDKLLKGSIAIIKADPDDSENQDFINNCRLDRNITEATIVMILPSGAVAGVFSGKVTKECLINTITSGGSCACKINNN